MTVEARVHESGGVLISGTGLRLDQEDDVAERVEACVVEMSDDLQRCVVLTWVARRPAVDVARRVGCSVPTVRRNLDRAAHVLLGWLRG